MAKTVKGKTHTWQMSDSPIGSGDAGEVYDVVCVEQPDLTGVMKKPTRIATGGTIMRQAGQIAQEALALERLDGLPLGKAHPPRLLDQAPEFTQGTANYFIISETAPGEDLAALLARSRQTGKPFPYRVIITVLDALFDLFSRAHKTGVLWNDVKLDHIYWHNPTGQIAVIDWGNALFLEQNHTKTQQQSLPRWEDYHQMLDTLGNFLQQTAPELYADLGWDEFLDQRLDSPSISILARRIAYQHQVIALKLMEYQSLMRVVLNDSPSLEGLQKIQTYQQVLEKLGAAWERQNIIKYSQALILASLAEKDIQTAVRTTSLVWALYDESLDLSWHLVREYFRKPDMLTHDALESLVKHTLDKNWTNALWKIIVIARDIVNPPWWSQLVPILRQKALGINTPSPYQACQSLLRWADAQGAKKAKQSNTLSGILHKWRIKGVTHEESPFDYTLLDLIREDADLPIRLRSEVKTSFANGERAIRELMQAWVLADWDGLNQAIHKFASWDPDRWGMIDLEKTVEDFQQWLNQLHQEPQPEKNIRSYFQQLLDKRPLIENRLGTTPWLETLKKTLDSINRGASIQNHQSMVKKWCPWLFNYPTIHAPENQAQVTDDNLISTLLSTFNEHLKNWHDVEEGLTAVKDTAPEYLPFCRKLTEEFQAVLSLNVDLSYLEQHFDKPIHPSLAECCEVVPVMLNWREHLAERDLPGAIQALNQSQLQGWPVLQHTLEETTTWHAEIVPTLNAIMGFGLSKTIADFETNQSALTNISNTCNQTLGLWKQIYHAGIHQDLLESLETTIEKARADFLSWRHSYEQSSDQVARLLFHTYLHPIRKISDHLFRLAQHSRQARISFAVNSKEHAVSPMTLLHAGENTLDHLGAIEGILIAESQERLFPTWQDDFSRLLVTNTDQTIQQMVLSLSDNHPLYGWLVTTIFKQ